jgi:hypothetical protein
MIGMPIIAALFVLLFLALIFGPQLYVRSLLSKHQQERPDIPGTGAELARHLLDMAQLRHVKVELTAAGDHYDPDSETVRLSLPHHDGRSVAAVAVAAHEVGHALQHAHGMGLFHWRTTATRQFMVVERVAQVLFFLIPVVAIITKSPALAALQLGVVVLMLFGRVLIHLMTLPVELDASFKRALPIIEAGGYLAPADLPAAQSVLKAAAWTYVAAALVSLLDVTRLIRILR